MSSSSYDTNVFINCPFDEEYKTFLHPMLFTIVYLGLHPQIAQTTDSGNTRMERIIELIKKSKYSIHDLSRNVSTAAGEIARFNMPFELGLDIGIRHASYRSKYSQKKSLIIEQDRFRYRKALSDISGNDIASYEGSPERLIHIIRHWFTTIIHPKQPSGPFIWEEFNEFIAYFESYTKEEGYTEDETELIPSGEIIYLMKEWVKERKRK